MTNAQYRVRQRHGLSHDRRRPLDPTLYPGVAEGSLPGARSPAHRGRSTSATLAASGGTGRPAPTGDNPSARQRHHRKGGDHPVVQVAYPGLAKGPTPCGRVGGYPHRGGIRVRRRGRRHNDLAVDDEPRVDGKPDGPTWQNPTGSGAQRRAPRAGWSTSPVSAFPPNALRAAGP